MFLIADTLGDYVIRLMVGTDHLGGDDERDISAKKRVVKIAYEDPLAR